MLKKISYDDLPVPRKANANSKFADKTIKEFVDLNIDAAVVTGFPLTRATASYVSALASAIKRQNVTRLVKVRQHEDTVYLVRQR